MCCLALVDDDRLAVLINAPKRCDVMLRMSRDILKLFIIMYRGRAMDDSIGQKLN